MMTPTQKTAGIVAMRGTFRHRDVRQALQRAGVAIDNLEVSTNLLLEEQKEAGNIRYQKQDDTWIKL